MWEPRTAKPLGLAMEAIKLVKTKRTRNSSGKLPRERENVEECKL